MKSWDSFYLGMLPLRNIVREVPAPSQITDDILVRDWTLTAEDRRLVLQCRTDTQRCEQAIELCVVRKHGRFLREKTRVPPLILHYLCGQLQIHWSGEMALQVRSSTRSAQNEKLLGHLGFRWFTTADARELREWLLEQAPVSGWNETLWLLLEKRLLEKKVIQPGATVLERLMANVLGQTQSSLLQKVSASLPQSLITVIDEMLSIKKATARSHFSKLKEHVPRAKVEVLLEYLKRYEFLKRLELEKVDLRILGPFVDRYAQRVKNEDTGAIRDWSQERQRVAMTCFFAMVFCFVIVSLIGF